MRKKRIQRRNAPQKTSKKVKRGEKGGVKPYGKKYGVKFANRLRISAKKGVAKT